MYGGFRYLMGKVIAKRQGEALSQYPHYAYVRCNSSLDGENEGHLV